MRNKGDKISRRQADADSRSAIAFVGSDLAALSKSKASFLNSVFSTDRLMFKEANE